MRLRSLNALRVFDVVASRLSFSSAATQLAMSQGAVSYRIKQLETELGFQLFDRSGQAVTLTEAGAEFRTMTSRVLGEIDETTLRLRRRGRRELILGLSTYFGSRWLLPRLTLFTAAFPDIILRLQPMTGGSLPVGAEVDVAVVWGSDDELTGRYDLLLTSTVTPMCGAEMGRAIKQAGLRDGFKGLTLIHEDETRDAWRKWLSQAGLNDRGARRGPIIPDSNMRVQAIMDGQGLALFDELVGSEVERGLLVAPSEIRLNGYGYYLALSEAAGGRPDVTALLTWLRQQATAWDAPRSTG